MIQAAKATAQLFVLAAVCLPALANIPRTPLVAEKPHLGVASFALVSHRAESAANPMNAPGIAGCLYDSGTRPCCSGKERDQETGLDYFGARYLMAGLGRFGSADPLMESGNPQNGQSWNRYAYTYNNPLRFVDPNGMCSGPPLQAGEMGVCIDLYIAAPKIGVIGEGDNRGPAPNDPKATYRQELQLALNPKTGGVRVVKDDPGVSEVLVVPDELGKLSPTLAAKGTSSTSVSPTTTDKQGNHHFAIYNEALNGIASLPYISKVAISDTIKTDVKFVFTPDGKVGLDPGGTRTAYPSIEIYRYDQSGKPTTLLQQKESGNPADLCCRNQSIPRVSPR
ncbi:RHS repeat-associated core domain-containing protein [Bryobacter aggregatus]|uniref:RHS repeat-associated core domain-containing protein n=1 Tax=Bryobacter aggregatus TaxID=360054 RepID=UPI0004E1DF93|nr:RHS repeat-associated core domain-containing protein [Bryobacter aggregatus]